MVDFVVVDFPSNVVIVIFSALIISSTKSTNESQMLLPESVTMPSSDVGLVVPSEDSLDVFIPVSSVLVIDIFSGSNVVDF